MNSKIITLISLMFSCSNILAMEKNQHKQSQAAQTHESAAVTRAHALLARLQQLMPAASGQDLLKHALSKTTNAQPQPAQKQEKKKQ